MTTCLIRLMSLVSKGIISACSIRSVVTTSVAMLEGTGQRIRTYDFITNRKRNSLAPQRAEDLVYVHYNKRCVLKSREPEKFAAWLHEDVQLLPAEGE